MADFKDVIDTLDKAADGFGNIANAEQKKIYEEVITLAKDLETDAQGKVKQTITNLKRLNQIKAKLAALSKDKEWVAGIGKFVKYFDILQKQQNAYVSTAFPQLTLGESAKKRNEMMKQIAVNNTIEALMGDGLKANVTDKLNDILLRGVTSGAKWADLQQELRDHLMGKEGGQGAFARYATTYATTALSQYTGQNNQMMTKDLGLEWFMYTGSNIETTREFCEVLTKKKWIHKSEIPTILQGKIEMPDGEVVEVAIYDKTGLPKGMIADTTPENFQCNCGGWNCRHQLLPVADAMVPAAIRAKFEKPKEPAKPQPVDLAPYYDQVGAIEQYIAGHPKSSKIKGYLVSVLNAAANGNQSDLEAILKAAKKDMNKFLAAEKSKAKNATSQKEQEEAKKAAEEIAKKIAQAQTLTSLVNPEQWVDQFTFEELKQANDYVAGHMSKWKSKGKEGQALVQAISDEVNKFLDKNHKTYAIVEEALLKQAKDIIKEIDKKAFDDANKIILQYTKDHNTKKVQQYYDKILQLEADGNHEEALAVQNEAIKTIKKFEAAARSNKKGAKKKDDTDKRVKTLMEFLEKNERAYSCFYDFKQLKDALEHGHMHRAQKFINQCLSAIGKDTLRKYGMPLKVDMEYLGGEVQMTNEADVILGNIDDAKIISLEEAYNKESVDHADKRLRGLSESQWNMLTNEEKLVITKYTQTFTYLNKPLRNDVYEFQYGPRTIDEYNRDVVVLTNALAKLRTKEDMVVRRGVSDYKIQEIGKYLSQVKEGDVFTDGGFLSTAIQRTKGFHEEINLVIYIPKGAMGFYAEPASFYNLGTYNYGLRDSNKISIWNGKDKVGIGNEEEWIGQRGSRFEVIKIEANTRVEWHSYDYTIHLKMIGQLYTQV